MVLQSRDSDYISPFELDLSVILMWELIVLLGIILFGAVAALGLLVYSIIIM